jgi:hypothetical protein
LGRSTSFIPAVPAAWSVTTIAFMIISPRSFQAVMTEAKLLPPDKRVLFLERIEAVVRLRHCDVQTAAKHAEANINVSNTLSRKRRSDWDYLPPMKKLSSTILLFRTV